MKFNDKNEFDKMIERIKKHYEIKTELEQNRIEITDIVDDIMKEISKAFNLKWELYWRFGNEYTNDELVDCILINQQLLIVDIGWIEGLPIILNNNVINLNGNIPLHWLYSDYIKELEDGITAYKQFLETKEKEDIKVKEIETIKNENLHKSIKEKLTTEEYTFVAGHIWKV